jgi:hypothetical protein
MINQGATVASDGTASKEYLGMAYAYKDCKGSSARLCFLALANRDKDG